MGDGAPQMAVDTVWVTQFANRISRTPVVLDIQFNRSHALFSSIHTVIISLSSESPEFCPHLLVSIPSWPITMVNNSESISISRGEQSHHS